MSDFKKKVIIDVLILASTLVVLGVFLYLFRANIEKFSHAAASAKSQRETYANASGQLSVLLKEWDVAKNYKDQIAALVPTRDDLVLLSRQLQDLSVRKGVTLVIMFGDEGKSSDVGVSTISFNGTIEGPVGHVADFLETLEQDYYAVQIKTSEISNQNKGDYVKVFMTGVVYFEQ